MDKEYTPLQDVLKIVQNKLNDKSITLDDLLTYLPKFQANIYTLPTTAVPLTFIIMSSDLSMAQYYEQSHLEAKPSDPVFQTD